MSRRRRSLCGDGGDSATDEHIAWARETAAAIDPWSVSGGYANYMQADEPLERVRAAYGADSFDRLRVLKSRNAPSACGWRVKADESAEGFALLRRWPLGSIW